MEAAVFTGTSSSASDMEAVVWLTVYCFDALSLILLELPAVKVAWKQLFCCIECLAGSASALNFGGTSEQSGMEGAVFTATSSSVSNMEAVVWLIVYCLDAISLILLELPAVKVAWKQLFC